MKKTSLKCQFLCFFFTTLNLIWPKFCPKTTITLLFLADFQWIMIRDSMNINNLLQSSSSEKKLVRPLKKLASPKMKNIFFAEITEADHQLSETFHFVKISYVLTELLILFYLSDVFFVKKVSFPEVLINPGNWIAS